MAIVAVDFTHLELSLCEGDELDDGHPLVELAPHLFVHPDPDPVELAEPVRIRGPLVPVNTPKSPKPVTTRKPKEA